MCLTWLTTTIYVEYSNEVWNFQFIQFGWNYDQAQQMVNNGTYGPIFNFDNINNPWAWGYRRMAWRAMGIGNIFRSVWGDCAINDRIRVVLGGQIAGPGVSEWGLDMINFNYGPPNNYLYAAPPNNLANSNGSTLTSGAKIGIIVRDCVGGAALLGVAALLIFKSKKKQFNW